MTAEEPIRPASELGWDHLDVAPATNDDINRMWLDDSKQPETAIIKHMIVRVKADAATIRERDEEIRKLEIIKINYRLSDNGRELESLRAQNAAQAEEIERLNQRVFDTHKGMLDRDADAQKWKRESAELRARCERYEGLIVRFHESHFAGADEWPRDLADEIRAEARAIRAREAGKP